MQNLNACAIRTQLSGHFVFGLFTFLAVWLLAASIPATAATPRVTNTPSTTAIVGRPYSYQPVISGWYGAPLTYSVSNKPSWASFSIATGKLSGTPTSAGTYSNIVITATDGRLRGTIASFSLAVKASSTTSSPPSPSSTSGSATLSWTPPTTNTNGSSLTNLAGYRVYYGARSSSLDKTVQVANPGITRYVIDHLGPGTYYFAVRAYTSGGIESQLSNIASKTIR